jgi:hypothetical protein
VRWGNGSCGISGLTGPAIVANTHSSESFYRHSIAFVLLLLLLLFIAPVDNTVEHNAKVLRKRHSEAGSNLQCVVTGTTFSRLAQYSAGSGNAPALIHFQKLPNVALKV